MSVNENVKGSPSHIREHNPILNTVIFIVMAIVVIACTIPFLYIIAMSFSSPAAITNNRVSLWVCTRDLKTGETESFPPIRIFSMVFSSPLR